MVAHTGFEPVISALRGRCPRPLDECAITPITELAGDRGFEPRLTDPESVVLPLDESPSLEMHSNKHRLLYQVDSRREYCRRYLNLATINLMNSFHYTKLQGARYFEGNLIVYNMNCGCIGI